MIEIKEADLEKYALTCVDAADIYLREAVNSKVFVIDSLRGAHPFNDLISYILNKKNLNDIINYPFPTSGFLYERKKLISQMLYSLFKYHSENKFGKFIFLDTMITGSSLRGFKHLLSGYIREYANVSNNYSIEFIIIGIKENGDYINQYYEKKIKLKNDNNFLLKHYFLNTGKIISEDIPELLGLDYPYKCGNGIKLPIFKSVNSHEALKVGSRKYVPENTTYELFLRLTKEIINNYI